MNESSGLAMNESSEVVQPCAAAPAVTPLPRPRRKKREDALLLALAGGISVAEAARRAGVGERTAFRRLTDPQFKGRVAEVRDKMLDDAVGQLAHNSSTAVETLAELCTSAQSEMVRLMAARALLEHAPKLRANVELQARMTALEQEASSSTSHLTPRKEISHEQKP
jgi:hypothetical protein